MKKICLLLIALFAISSCIKEEALNSEADIISCSIDDNSILKREPIIQNDKIQFIVTSNADLTRQAPKFTVTEGATIEPESGTVRDFSFPQNYTVTSQDGQWSKTYTISFIKDEMSTAYHFEDTIRETNNKYFIFAEKSNGSTIMEWASGNIGYSITGSAQSPYDYPTMQADNGYIGKCACLVTRSTGSFGAMAGMPIAAGNLFIGSFNILNALSSPLKATQFGLPFYHEPKKLSGYYMYKSGDVYYKNGKPTNEKIKDKCHIYAIFYETDDTLKTLDGTNIQTNPNIISAAIVEETKETEKWTYFEIPFSMRNGKIIDADKLREGKYNLAVVFTSSIEGAAFSGAPGSTLYIDEVEIHY